ncbi:MAG: DUF4440 domain-containing protein [Bacteroidota bacterium]
MKILVLFPLILSLTALAQPTSTDHPLQALVKSELAFAKMSEERGTKAAFLTFLAEDAILFRPHPVNGKKWMTASPVTSSLLTWYPSFADISNAGDLGYTTGPYEYRAKGNNDSQVSHGYFVSIWKKQPDGSWKVFMDLGTTNPPPGAKPRLFQPDTRSNTPRTSALVDQSAERKTLFATDAAFAELSVSGGVHTAYETHGAQEIRWMRPQRFPVLGKDSTLAAVTERAGVTVWRVTDADIARSGDLACTYGKYEWKKNSTDEKPSGMGNYVKLWRKQADGSWKIVLDVIVPLSPP